MTIPKSEVVVAGDFEQRAATDGLEIANQLSLIGSGANQSLNADQDADFRRHVQAYVEQERSIHDQSLQPYLGNPLLQSAHRNQPTMFLNIEGLSEASIQLLMRHSPQQFPQQQQPQQQQQQQQQPSVMSHVQRAPSVTIASVDDVIPVVVDSNLPRCGSAEIVNPTAIRLPAEDSVEEDLFFADGIGAFQPTHFGSVGMIVTPRQEVIGQSQSQSPGAVAAAFPPLSSMPLVDINANYCDRNSFPAFFDVSIEHFHQPMMTASMPTVLTTSGLMTTTLSPAADGCKFASDCFGDDSRRLAELKAWLMTDC